MSDCCGDQNNNSQPTEQTVQNNPPKSWFGKYLYNLGKKDHQKQSPKKEHKGSGGCC